MTPRRPTRQEYERRALLERIAVVRPLFPDEVEDLRALRALDKAWDAHTRERSRRRKADAR